MNQMKKHLYLKNCWTMGEELWEFVVLGLGLPTLPSSMVGMRLLLGWESCESWHFSAVGKSLIWFGAKGSACVHHHHQWMWLLSGKNGVLGYSSFLPPDIVLTVREYLCLWLYSCALRKREPNLMSPLVYSAAVYMWTEDSQGLRKKRCLENCLNIKYTPYTNTDALTELEGLLPSLFKTTYVLSLANH